MLLNFAGFARRFELQARSALAQGHAITASDGFFAAFVMYGGAQWPIFANTDLNLAPWLGLSGDRWSESG